jgi:hypothetical protein
MSTPSSFLSLKSLTIPANGTVLMSITGQIFSVKEASATFYVAFDEGEFFPMEAGLQFRLTNGDFFKLLRFQNTSGTDITAQIYIGRAEVLDSRLNTPLSPTYTFLYKDPVTRATGSGVLSLAGTTSAAYAGTNSGDQRKQFVVANLDPSLVLHVRTSGGVVMGFVPGYTSWTVDTSADLQVYNPNAGSVNYCVGQVWYD